MKAKSNPQRQAELRKRRTERGLVLLQGIWIPKALLPIIKAQIQKTLADHSSDGLG